MKRMVSLLLCGLLMVFAFTGCKQNADPKAAYAAAAQKNSELKATDLTMEMAMKGEAEGESVDINMDTDMKVVPKDNDNMDMAMKMTYQMMGMTLEMPIYYTDGYAYMELLGQKVKVKASKDDLQSKGPFDITMEKFDESFFKEIQVGEQKDGGTSYTYIGDPDKLGQIGDNIKEQLKSLTSEMGVKIDFSDANGSFTIDKDGYLSAQTVNLKMAMEAQGESVTFDISVTIKLNNPGQAVTIDFPDFSDYQESDQDISSLLGSDGI